MTPKINPVSSLLLYSACFATTPEVKAKMVLALEDITDWKKAAKVVVERQGAGLVLRKLAEMGLTDRVPSEIVGVWKQARMMTISRHMVLAEHFRRVASVLVENGIEVIAMKGIYLSEGLYPEPGLRQFSDIDLLVREEYGELTISILQQMGYRVPDLLTHIPDDIAEATEALHFPPMTMGGVSIEVHTLLVRPSAPFSIDMSEVWHEAIPVSLHGAPAKVFSPEYQFLTVAQHLDKHFRQGKFQMTGFYDLINIVSTNPFKINWNRLLELCHQTSSTSLVMNYMGLMSECAFVVVPKEFEHAKIDPEYKMIFEDVLEKGISTRLSIKKTLIANSTKTSILFHIRRILFLFLPPASYMRSKYNLKPTDSVYGYYFKRIWKRFQMTVHSKY